MCHTKIVMTPKQYLYHQECKKKRKYPFERITHGPEEDLKASYDSHISQFKCHIMSSKSKLWLYSFSAGSNLYTNTGTFLEEEIIRPFKSRYEDLGFRQASGDEIDQWVKKFSECTEDASYTASFFIYTLLPLLHQTNFYKHM